MARSVPESEDDFIRMQQDAIRRVREMQERARRTLEDAGLRIQPEESQAANQPPEPQLPEPPQMPRDIGNEINPVPVPPAPRPSGQNRSNTPPHSGRPPQLRPAAASPGHSAHQMSPPALLQQLMNGGLTIPETVNVPMLNISLGRDQIMLIILLYILIKDGADQWLILALAYIMFT